MKRFKRPLVFGVTGGSGSGKSRLASYIKEGLGGRATIFCLDWYYRDQKGVGGEARESLNFDHPQALEIPFCVRQLDRLRAGEPIRAPVYDYATHTRAADTREIGRAHV